MRLYEGCMLFRSLAQVLKLKMNERDVWSGMLSALFTCSAGDDELFVTALCRPGADMECVAFMHREIE